MENGGAKRLLYDLLHRDISNFNKMQFPVACNKARFTQMKFSFKPYEAFWYQILKEEAWPSSDGNAPTSIHVMEDLGLPGIKVLKSSLTKAFSSFCCNIRASKSDSDISKFGVALAKMAPSKMDYKPVVEGQREYYIRFENANIEQLRREFADYCGIQVDIVFPEDPPADNDNDNDLE